MINKIFDRQPQIKNTQIRKPNLYHFVVVSSKCLGLLGKLTLFIKQIQALYGLAAVKLIDGFDPIVYVQFFINMVDMFSHGLLADKQKRSYLLVKHALGK
jgi:hypothetical protein